MHFRFFRAFKDLSIPFFHRTLSFWALLGCLQPQSGVFFSFGGGWHWLHIFLSLLQVQFNHPLLSTSLVNNTNESMSYYFLAILGFFAKVLTFSGLVKKLFLAKATEGLRQFRIIFSSNTSCGASRPTINQVKT